VAAADRRTAASLRVGVLASTHRSDGGIFQYGLSLVEALRTLAARGAIAEVVLVDSGLGGLPDELVGASERIVALPRQGAARALAGPLTRIVGAGRLRSLWGRVLRHSAAGGGEPVPREAWRSALVDAGVDVVVYPAPTPVALQAGVSFVVAIHDLQHRLQPEFDEVTAGGEAERRDVLFGALAEQALVVLADSEVGCEDILRFYGDRIAAERIAPLPFVALARFDSVGAAEVEAVREWHGLKASYLFYPAQLWPHKNHVRIVEAVGRLRADGLPVEVAFTGSPAPGPRAAVHRDLHRRAAELGIEDAVHLLGELPGDEVAPLYAGAVALVMPTFFGPTNIPVLEAWAVGCPVITSDIRGIREQTGDAAVLVDPRSTESIAEGIARVWQDEALRRRLIDAGHARLATWDRAAFANRLEEVLVRAASELGQ
jgi:glycosyltransferase involved in cell wall biosynthesis